MGSMELEYEGDPSFLTEGIEALLVTMSDLSARVPPETPPLVSNNAPTSASTSAGAYNFSTNTIAAHLDAKTGPELLICAMAQLELVQGKASASRTEILGEMKSATSYYNEGFRKNMTNSLQSLTKSKRINQIATDSYALSSAEKKKVEAKVAEIG